MVVGNGMVAQRFLSFREQDKVLIFASGVSNSQEKSPEAFSREEDLLKKHMEQSRHKLLVYFSTCSIYDPELQHSPYVKHKIQLEKLIQDQQAHYLICRVSNLAGSSQNPHTLLNFLVEKIREGLKFNLWEKAWRNIIDVDDFFLITNYLIQNYTNQNLLVNIANPKNYTILDIVQAIEKMIQKRALYDIQDRGNLFNIQIEYIRPILKSLKINFEHNYLDKVLNKYYQ